MENVADNVHQEFWRPPVTAPRTEISSDVRTHTEICQECGTEFVMGARYCHVCGSGRDALMESHSSRLLHALDFNHIREVLGLSVGSLIAFVVGMICTFAAIVTGFLFTANTVLDWQAVQAWRIEWLLAAAVAFVAGILLKRPQA